MLVILIGLLAMVGSWSIAHGDQLPITSQDVLRNYALGHVTHGSRAVFAPSIDWDYNESVTHAQVSGNGAEAVLDGLFAIEFKYRLVNPDDTITGYVYLYGENDTTLFFGSASFTAADLEAGRKPQYNVWLQEVPLLELSNVTAAEVLAIDENGQTAKHHNINVKNGHPLFQPWMAGAPNGILVVRFEDGSLMRYDLSVPVGETPSTTTETASSWKIDAHHIFGKINCQTNECPRPVNINIKIIELWTRPTVLMEYTAGQTVTFDVTGLVQENGNTTFERPFEARFEQVDGPWAGGVLLNRNEPTTTGEFPISGKYRIYFGWEKFALPNTFYTGPEGPSGGKG